MCVIIDLVFDWFLLGWCFDKNFVLLDVLIFGNVIVSIYVVNEFGDCYLQLILLLVENLCGFFWDVLNVFFVLQFKLGQVNFFVVIDELVEMDCLLVEIGVYVVIEVWCKIGKWVIIGYNIVVLEGIIIGDDCKIGVNCIIGGVGFGYEQNEEGENEFILYIGNVELKEYVEIGNNVCIDWVVLGFILLQVYVKVDNLVYIVYGVQIGCNSFIIVNVMIVGFVVIGENVWVLFFVFVCQKLEIGDRLLVGFGVVVVKNV